MVRRPPQTSTHHHRDSTAPTRVSRRPRIETEESRSSPRPTARSQVALLFSGSRFVDAGREQIVALPGAIAARRRRARFRTHRVNRALRWLSSFVVMGTLAYKGLEVRRAHGDGLLVEQIRERTTLGTFASLAQLVPPNAPIETPLRRAHTEVLMASTHLLLHRYYDASTERLAHLKTWLKEQPSTMLEQLPIIARAHLTDGLLPDTPEYFLTLAKHAPSNLAFLAESAMVLSAKQRPEVDRVLKQLKLMDDASPWTLLAMSFVAARKGRRRTAFRLAQKALDSNPDPSCKIFLLQQAADNADSDSISELKRQTQRLQERHRLSLSVFWPTGILPPERASLGRASNRRSHQFSKRKKKRTFNRKEGFEPHGS